LPVSAKSGIFATENEIKTCRKATGRRTLLGNETLDDILNFHVRFEQIHPFQDGNGRVGRLLMFKDCLANGIVPFIITDDLKFFYYRGLREWGHINGFLADTCLTAQDQYKSLLNYFNIAYQ